MFAFLKHNKLAPLFLLFASALFLPTFVFSETIHVFLFNDFHGQVSETGKNPGMAKLVSAFKSQLDKSKNNIIVAGGDNYQGGVLSNLTDGAPVTDMMRELHVAASAVGNHDFDWGVKWLKPWEKQGNFVFLASNIFDKKSGQPVTWAKPYLIVNKANIKIAFIGLATLETPYTTKHSIVKNFTFQDASISGQKWINFLKSGKAKQGRPNAIIALTHIPSFQDPKTGKITGPELYHLISQTHGFDAILTAHSHREVMGNVGTMPVLQAYDYGRDIGELTLTFNKVKRLIHTSLALHRLDNKQALIQPDLKALATYRLFYNQFKHQLNQEIGQIDHPLTRNNPNGVSIMGNFLCEAIRKHFNAPIAIVNAALMREDLPAGKITFKKLFDVLPFADEVITLEIPGKTIAKLIEHGFTDPDIAPTQYAGIKIRTNNNHKILRMTLENGKTINPDQYYRVITTQFIFTGGDNYVFSDAKSVQNLRITALQVVIDYLKSTTKKTK